MMDLGPQFGMTPAGMHYRRAAPQDMRRAAVVDPSVPVRQQERHKSEGAIKNDYYSPEIRQTHSLTTTRELKVPRIYPNPNVTEPHTVAFSDFHEEEWGGGKSVYVDYVHTRVPGQGHGRRLLEGIADAHPEHELDFGEVYHPAALKVVKNLADRGRKVHYKDFT